MFYNMYFTRIHIFAAKVHFFFDIAKFICFFLQKSSNPCIFQKKVVTLHAIFKIRK